MAVVAARGAASITAIDGDASGNGIFDLSTPAGWHFLFWWASVIILALMLWAL